MNDNQSNATFQYTYSAREQAELRSIRNKYLPKEENKMELLRKLDAQVTQRATMHAMVVGIIGALILGVGMCCTILWSDQFFVLGITVGIIGILIAAMALPIYNRTTKIERERVAPEILRLTDALIK